MPSRSPDYVSSNRAFWAEQEADYARAAERSWRSEPTWGIWRLPEQELGLLPPDPAGLRCIELGCGTAYVSAWLARRGALPTGIDPTPSQLATARRMQRRHDLAFPLVEAIAERLPFPDASFDFAISEYGAALWSDPRLWVPEAARVLRPGARLTFLTNSAFVVLCAPELEADGPLTDRLLRPYLGMHRQEWPDTQEIEFHLPHGEWIDLLAVHGFAVERLLELGAPPGATTRFAWADPEWARSWPTEEVWTVRKRA